MAHREKDINISRQNYSVIDNEFGNMKERFENEMKRVENEMSRLKREFEGYTPPKMSQHQFQSQQQESVSSFSSSQMGPRMGDISHIDRPRYDPYLDNLKSPLIKDDSDGKSLRLRFNVSQYKPEEITVKTVDNRLLVHAKHEEKSPQKTVYREYNQEFMLPRGTNPELITSTLSTDGVLTVEAPLPAIEAPKNA